MQALISLWLPICCILSHIWSLPSSGVISASSPAAYLVNLQHANFDAVGRKGTRKTETPSRIAVAVGRRNIEGKPK